jgi:flavin-dependent dehydrogenase
VLARRLGAHRHRDDRLVAVYGVLSAADRDSRTLIEAVPGGWWYAALIPGGRRVVAFLTDADLLAAELRTPAGFAAAARLGAGGTLVAGPFTAPAFGSRLDPCCGDDWLAAGDAALAFDPISSQGILSALFGGLTAGRAADARLRGDRDALPAYAQRLATIRAAYERNHAQAYALERRFTEHAFWARRIGSTAWTSSSGS